MYNIIKNGITFAKYKTEALGFENCLSLKKSKMPFFSNFNFFLFRKYRVRFLNKKIY